MTDGSAEDGLIHGPPPRRRRKLEAAITLGCLVAWMSALVAIAALSALTGGAGPAAPVGMVALFLAAWATAEHLVRGRGMVWPGSMLGLVGPICLGFATALIGDAGRALPPDQRFAVITAVSAAGMLLFLFRFRLAPLVSPIVTFTVVSLFLSIRGFSAETVAQVEGFSPRGILAALVDEPFYMALFGILAGVCVGYARWLDLRAGEFGMASAKPLHFIGSGVASLIAGRLAAGLPLPLDLAMLAALFALAMAWSLRIDRIGVMLTTWFAMARPLVLSLLPLTGGTLGLRDWSVAHGAVLGVGLVLWTILRRRTVASGFTRKPRNVTWNWPDRVIYPYRPPPGYR